MANLVKTQNFGGPEKQILIAEDSYKVTLGVTVTNTGISANSEGKKIIKAGTPLTGSFAARNTAFTIATTTPAGEGTPASTNAVCVALHDVDVTAGETNATVVIAGAVDLNKLEASVQTLLTSTVEAALPRIIFFKS